VGAGPVDLGTVYRLALVGMVSTMTGDDQGRPLNLGGEQQLATVDKWIALRIRDCGPIAPGLGRPAKCQPHQLRCWDRHCGPTDLDNLTHRQYEP